MNNSWIQPTELHGQFATLKPLDKTDLEPLIAAVSDGDIWKVRVAQVPHPDKMQDEIERRLSLQQKAQMLPFTIRNAQGQVIGMTCYANIDNAHRRTDIGWTWYSQSAQRTPINSECKYLLLKHAFEQLNAIAVGFRVDALNQKSQKAVERIGAKKDGLIRNYSILEDGNLRDMIFYSIIQSEWPNIKAHIEWLMQR